MSQATLTGLVVCGGASLRMGRDKSMIRYYEKEQRYHIADMLNLHCTAVVLSLNDKQHSQEEVYTIIRDLTQYQNSGPIAAILSAFHTLPQSNFIVIGCDYPLLTEKELSRFISSIADYAHPNAFYNEADGFYEPLLGYYPSTIADTILQHFEKGNKSLQQMLKGIACEQYFPEDKNCTLSVDDATASEQVKQWLNAQKRMME